MADYAQVMLALRAADAAGNKEDAARLAQIASGLQPKESPPTEQSKPEQSTFDKVRGAVDTAAKLSPSGMLQSMGGMAMDTINKGLEYVGNLAGEKTQEGATALGASPEVAGAAGAGVNAITQIAAPGAAGGALAKGVSKIATKAAPIAAEAAATAEKMVTQAGIKWGELTRAARNRFTELAQDSEKLGQLDKPAMERVARAASLEKPVTLTKGQSTREPGQLRTEEQLAQTEAGKPIRERHMSQDETLQENLDVLKGKTGARAKGTEEVGANVDKAIKSQIRKSESNINRLYNKARAAGEMESTIDLQPLAEHFNKNPGTNKYAVGQLKDMRLFAEDQFGNLVPTHNITINELEKVRQQATKVARTSTDGVTKHEAGDLIKQIDGVIPEGAGGDAYKAARAARKEHAMQFEEPKAISQIVENKSKTDRVTALENVWDKTILSKSASIADVERVRDTLLKSTDRVTRDAGRKAWKDIAGQTVEYIKDQAVSGAKDQAGKQNLSPAKLNAAIDRIGDKKLEILLGKDTVKKLREIAKTVEDVKTMPPYKGGSTTTANAVTLLEKVLEKGQHAPFITDIGRGAVRVLSNVQKAGAAAGKVEESLANPQAAKRGGDTLRKIMEENQGNIGATMGAALPLRKQDDARQ